MKTCPDCAEQVQDAARICRYCGHRFDAAGSPAPVATPAENPTTQAPAVGKCPRCGVGEHEGRFCDNCGLDFSPSQHRPMGYVSAARREQVWLAEKAREHGRPPESASTPTPPQPATDRGPKISNRAREAVGLMLIALLIWLWSQGTFDKVLVDVGLNANECATNAFGATFCGDELKEYQERFPSPDAPDTTCNPLIGEKC